MNSGTSPLPAVQLVGAVLNRRYRLTRPLGQGGMGVVYAGEVEGTRQAVAIKLLRAEYLDDTAIVARFVEEAHIAARIVHPNVLRVFDVQRAEDGTPYLVMELLEGQPLASLLKAQSRLPVAQAVTMLQGVLAGLGAAHGLGVVHRDLKPDNVYLSHAGPGGAVVVKLLDFGIAKVMDAAGGMGNQTKTGMLLGTPAYMSPEQIKNAKDVDARTDLWSAGVMFYEMITGRQAFPAPTEFARLAAVLGTQPDPIVGVDPTLAPWAPFVERAMHKDRAQRFQSAAEMAHAIAAVGAAPALAAELVGSRVPQTPVVLPAPPRDSSMPPPPVMPIPNVMVPGAPPPGFESTKPSATGHSPSLPPGGTLASPSSNQRRSSVAPEPQVVLLNQGDAESRSFRDDEPRRGVAPLVVAILVILALGAGFLLGYAVAKAG